MGADRFEIIKAGFAGDSATARAALHDDDDNVRSSALRALARTGDLRDSDLRHAISDPSDAVRRSVAELSARHPGVDITSLIDDENLYVAEMSAWAIGERPDAGRDEVDVLITAAVSHSEGLVREAAAAALGSIGDPRGIDAIITACSDKPTVRRRAVLALAPFMDDPRVEPVLRNALEDRDWQVRQNAEDLLNPRF